MEDKHIKLIGEQSVLGVCPSVFGPPQVGRTWLLILLLRHSVLLSSTLARMTLAEEDSKSQRRLVMLVHVQLAVSSRLETSQRATADMRIGVIGIAA